MFNIYYVKRLVKKERGVKMTESEKKFENGLVKNVYSLFDTALSVYDSPFVMTSADLSKFLDSVVNDVASKYYDNPQQFEVFNLGIFDDHVGEFITNSKQSLGNLSQYVDTRKREIQECIRTLNFLPVGYFKMPAEMQKDIQDKIDEAVRFYVKEFCTTDVSDTMTKVINS